MKLLFMSNLFPKETKAETQAKMKFNMYDAADVLQWNLINGLEKNNANLSLINLLPVDSWPQRYKDAFVKRYPFSHKQGAEDINVGYCNVKYIKQILLKTAYTTECKRWEKKTRKEDRRVVIAYSLNRAFIAAIKKMKRKDPQIKAVAIVADLPEFSAGAPNILRRIYRDYLNRKIKNSLSIFDGFVLLTDQMAHKLEIKVPYIVMEGIAGAREEIVEKKTAKKTVFYSGSLNAKYGIIHLLEAFAKIKDGNMKLVLCGLGDAQDVIEQHAKQDPRISFLGKVPHEQVLALQQEAAVLVNPRQNNEEFTKYSFPSKTMEYLASGTPVVAYKLDGIPDEYDAYLNYVDDNFPESLAAKLTEICNLDETVRAEMGKRGAAFVLKNKNAQAQTKRILDFIREKM